MHASLCSPVTGQYRRAATPSFPWFSRSSRGSMMRICLPSSEASSGNVNAYADTCAPQATPEAERPKQEHHGPLYNSIHSHTERAGISSGP